jgi:hypothetical protein
MGGRGIAVDALCRRDVPAGTSPSAFAGRILRPYPGKKTAEIHDYHDAATGVLAAALAGRALGYSDSPTPAYHPDNKREPPSQALSHAPTGTSSVCGTVKAPAARRIIRLCYESLG